MTGRTASALSSFAIGLGLAVLEIGRLRTPGSGWLVDLFDWCGVLAGLAFMISALFAFREARAPGRG